MLYAHIHLLGHIRRGFELKFKAAAMFSGDEGFQSAAWDFQSAALKFQSAALKFQSAAFVGRSLLLPRRPVLPPNTHAKSLSPSPPCSKFAAKYKTQTHMEIILHSEQELPEAAKRFVQDIDQNTVFAFYGKMGAGKTTFI